MTLLDASPHLVLPDHIIAWVSQYPQADSGRTVQDVRRPLASAGKEGSRSSQHGGPPESKRPTRPLGRSPYSPSFFLFVLGKPRFGLPWISLLLLRTPTAAPSRARFCLCGNRLGPPFVSMKSRPPVRDGLTRELCPGMETRRSCSFPLLALTRPMDSMLGIHRDHASGPHDLCNAVSVARDES